MNNKIHHKDEDHELSFEIEKYLQSSKEVEIDNSVISAILSRTVRVNLIGWPVKDFNLLNWVKSLSANPTLSGLHAIYMDDSNSVLLHSALSAIRPFVSFSTESCMAYNPQTIIETASIIGTDKIFLLIQHPCGPLIPSSEERNLAISAQEQLGSLFNGIIISGSRSYTLINGNGEYETIEISKGDSIILTALKRFRYILENHRLFQVLLGVNSENRIVFWSFNKADYPYELYHQVIEALEGTCEYLLRPDPSAWEKIGDFENPIYPELPNYSLQSLDNPFNGYQRTVIVNSVNERKGKKSLMYRSLLDPSLLERPIRNPEILSGRLITGAEIEIIEHGRDEVTLLLDEEDLIPEEMLIHFKDFVPRYKTYFGVVSEPDNNRGKYCSLLNNLEEYFTVCIGKYEVHGETGFCHKEIGKWNIRHGLIERYLYNNAWFNKCPVKIWKHESLNLSDTFDFLTMEKLNLNFRKYILNRSYFEDFISCEWTPGFFRKQAKLGFTASTIKIEDITRLRLQLSESHTRLDWDKLKIDKKVRTILRKQKEKKIILRLERDPELVIEQLLTTWKDSLWLSSEYIDLIRKLSAPEEQKKDKQFAIWGVTLLVGDDQIPVAGELGYAIGKTYTSLSGFFRRDQKKYSNYGKLQMVMLAAVLEKEGFAFWNLSHPYIQKKSNLIGAYPNYDRNYYLKKWDDAIVCDTPDICGEILLYEDLKVECKDGYEYEYDFRRAAHDGKIVIYKEPKKSKDDSAIQGWFARLMDETEKKSAEEYKKVCDEIKYYQEQIQLLQEGDTVEEETDDPFEVELVSENYLLEELKKEYETLKARKESK